MPYIQDRPHAKCFKELQSALSLNGFSIKDCKNVFQGLVNTFKELMNISARVAGHIASDPFIMDAIAHSETIRHHRSKPTQTDCRAGESTGGQDVVVYGGICWILVQTGQCHSFRISQVAHGKKMAIKPLT